MGRPIAPETPKNISGTENSGDYWEEENPVVQLAHKRTIMLAGDITEGSVAITIAHILNLSNESNKPIKLIINTEGGSVDEMLALYDIIQFVPTPIHTVGLGKIMSCGLFLLASGEKGQRKIGKNARGMYHMIYGDIHGNVLDYEREGNETKRMQQQVNSILSKHSKLTEKELDEMMKKNEDIYLTSEKLIKVGVADEFLGS